MNAVSTPNIGRPTARDVPPVAVAAPPDQLALGIQLCRASIMSLMRLQLAFARGDRASAMAAIDHLHALDGEAERIMGDLPEGVNDPQHQRIAQTLREEKMAVAFEKLVLASGIDGPDLASPPPFLRQGPNASVEASEPDLEVDSPAGARMLAHVRTYGARAALFLAIGAGTATLIAFALG